MSAHWTDFSAVKRAFAHRVFARYTAANSLSLTGLWVQRLTVGWLVWDLSHSGFWLGAVVFAELVPVIVIGPFGGVLADRINRIRLTLVCQCLAVAQAALLCALSAGGLITVELLVLLSLALGVLAGLNQPSRLALIPSLVAKEDMITAIAINAISFNLARFVGPAIAGLIITMTGPSAAFAFNAVSYLWFIQVLFTLRALPQETGAGRGRVIAQIAEAVRYAARHPLIGPLLLIVATSSLFARPLAELLPGIADTVFGRGADGLAILVSSVGIGAVAGSLWLAKRGDLRGMTRVVVFALLVAGIADALAVIIGVFWLAAVLLCVFGVAMVILGAGVQSLIQTNVAPEMRGRVLSLNGLTVRGAPALGALFMGWAGDYVGLGPPLVAGAVVCGIVFLVMIRHEPRLGAAAGKLDNVERIVSGRGR